MVRPEESGGRMIPGATRGQSSVNASAHPTVTQGGYKRLPRRLFSSIWDLRLKLRALGGEKAEEKLFVVRVKTACVIL